MKLPRNFPGKDMGKVWGHTGLFCWQENGRLRSEINVQADVRDIGGVQFQATVEQILQKREPDGLCGSQ